MSMKTNYPSYCYQLYFDHEKAKMQVKAKQREMVRKTQGPSVLRVQLGLFLPAHTPSPETKSPTCSQFPSAGCNEKHPRWQVIHFSLLQNLRTLNRNIDCKSLRRADSCHLVVRDFSPQNKTWQRRKRNSSAHAKFKIIIFPVLGGSQRGDPGEKYT